MGIMDILFGGDQAQTQSAPSINPTDINPIYGIPEGLLAEIKKEQQKAEMGQAISNLFGGAANIARGAQGGAPVYDPGIVAGASGSGSGSGSGLAIDGIVDRAMKFSQLRDMMDKRQQIAAQRAAIPQIAKQLGIPESMAAGLVDKLPDMFVRHQDAQFNATADVRKIVETAKAGGITDPLEIQKIVASTLKQGPKVDKIMLPGGEEMSVQIHPNGNVTDLSGTPLPPDLIRGANAQQKLGPAFGNEETGYYAIDPKKREAVPLVAGQQRMPDEIKLYQQVAKDMIAKGETPPPLDQWLQNYRQSGQQKIEVRTGNTLAENMVKNFTDNVPKIQSRAMDIGAIHNAKEALESGIFAGQGAEWQRTLAKVGSALGIDDSRLQNTESFMQATAQRVLPIVKNLGSGSGITDADREFAKDIAGGNIRLEEGTLRRILDIAERANRAEIVQHNKIAKSILESNPDIAKTGLGPMLFVQEPEPFKSLQQRAQEELARRRAASAGGGR